MSSLMKSNVATQENPIFDVPIPAPASFAFPSGLEERPIPEAGHQVPAEAAQLPQIIRGTSNLINFNPIQFPLKTLSIFVAFFVFWLVFLAGFFG